MCGKCGHPHRRHRSRSRSRSRKRSSSKHRYYRASSRVRIGPLRRGELKRYGYSSGKHAEARRRALAQAVQRYGPTSVFRKLNALSVLNKNRSPGLAMIFRGDRNWIRRHFMRHRRRSHSRR